MAVIEITPFVTPAERALMIAAHNGQSAVTSGDVPILTEYDFRWMDIQEATYADIPVIAVRRNREFGSLHYGMLEVVVDAEDERTLAMYEAIGAGEYGWKLLPDGTLRNTAIAVAPITVRITHSTYDWYNFYGDYNNRYSFDGRPAQWQPKIEVNLTLVEDDGLPIDADRVKNADGQEFEGITGSGSARVAITSGRMSFSVGHYSTRQITGGDVWDQVKNWHLYRGYDASDSNAAKLAGQGNANKLSAALGVPATPDSRYAVAVGPKHAAPSKGRFIDIDVDGQLDPGAIGTFPAYLAAPALTHYETRTTMDHVFRGGRSRQTRKVELLVTPTGVQPLCFGLTSNHKALCLPRYNDKCGLTLTHDLYETHATESAFWSAATDRLLVLRSPLGWHGVFLIAARMGLTSHHDTREAHLAYMIPVFVPHAESKHTRSRYRNLPAAAIDAIQKTYGLDHFLTQALYMLEGAKAKARRAGYDICDLPRAEKLPLPAGHTIRAWGHARENPKFCVTRVYGKLARNRAHTAVASVLGWSSANGHVPFYAGAGAEPMAANVQPVATRRVLDI